MIKGYIYQTKLGPMTILEKDGFLVGIELGEQKEQKYPIEETEVIKRAYGQIEEYLTGKRRRFDLPLRPEGSEFQQQVWKALLEIPHGKTCSYKDLAVKIQRPKACRAVGGANNKNPLPILIPCHRVIGNNGKLVGYRGGLEMKEKLLRIESSNNDQ